MYLEYLGTFFNFEGSLIQDRDCSAEEWDDIVMLFANPHNAHTVTVPFNQGEMTWEFYVSSGERDLILVTEDGNRWARKLKLTLTAMSAQWLAGENLQGVDN